jgi:signal transduction histidine kinase
MITNSQAPIYSTRLLAPRRGTTIRTLVEAAMGCGVLFALGELLQRYGSVGGAFARVPILFGLLWLTVWPAWRLKPIEHPRGWVRIGLGLARALGVGVLLAVLGTVVSAGVLGGYIAWHDDSIILFWFMVLRALVMGGAVVARRVRRRFRWQLIVSHVGIIVLMFVTLTSAGSVVGVIVASHFIGTHSVDMAASVRDELQLAGAVSPLNVRRADRVFRLIDDHRLPLRGESPLITFVRSPLVPTALGLVATDGRVLQGRVVLGQDGKKSRLATSWADLVHLTPAQGARLRRLALHGRAGLQRIQGRNGPQTVVEVPIRSRDGAASSMVVLRVTDYQPTQQQFFQVLVAVFSLSTIALIFITAIPMLGLSFLFSYLVARGLTRRLESLSGVATSIASGQLEERAPVTTRNEVGRLAEDVNRMADHLQTTMAELEGARARSDEALRLRQELVANISHELRTPLATMRAHLETIPIRDSVPAGGTPADGGGDVTIPASTLEALETETERLEALVDDLFALSRAQAGPVEMRVEPVDVTTLVDEMASLMRPLAQREGKIALSAEIVHRPLWAVADPARLQQILANLIRNAVRHTPDGGIIIVSVRPEAEWVKISVADTGEGISAEHLPHIFDRFYRADPARSRATVGAGLGLAIVREFVELMGGRVEVESVVGEGTRFHVFLPAAPW